MQVNNYSDAATEEQLVETVQSAVRHADIGGNESSLAMVHRMAEVEGELKLLRAEVQATLMDIRELLVDAEATGIVDRGSASATQGTWSKKIYSQMQRSGGQDEQQGVLDQSDPDGLGILPNGFSTEQPELSLLNGKDQWHRLEGLDPNLLASLLRWAVLVAKYIGQNQLPTFMDLCGFTGSVPQELRELIFGIAENLSGEALVDESDCSKWIDLMLQLHGIINPTGIVDTGKR